MVKTMTVVELDVHGRSTQAAAIDLPSGPAGALEVCGRCRSDKPPSWRDADRVSESWHKAPCLPSLVRVAVNM